MTNFDPAARRRLATAIVDFEERAAIIEYDAGASRNQAEALAAKELGMRPQWSGSIVRVLDIGGAAVGEDT